MSIWQLFKICNRVSLSDVRESLFQALGPETAKLHSLNLVHICCTKSCPVVAVLKLLPAVILAMTIQKSMMYCCSILGSALNISKQTWILFSLYVYITDAVRLAAVGWHSHIYYTTHSTRSEWHENGIEPCLVNKRKYKC